MPEFEAAALRRLLAIMARLRDPVVGCEWDRAQTWASIAPYTIEEAYEVADAIDRGAIDDVKDELGDLLFQVVFQARIAEEAGLFGFADVAAAIADKMERRHPHIFGDVETRVDWETLKAIERDKHADASALAGVAAGMPALMRAVKLQKRAARTGFDWPDPSGPRDKIVEEIEEVALASSDKVEEEVGDLLFAVVNFARHLGVDPEAALRQASGKFERRFRSMETAAEGRFASLSLDEQERLWKQVKVAE